MNQDSFPIYWESITSFRNGFIAHRSINNIKPVPHLDIVLNVALKHDEWIRKIIEPDILDSPTLK